MMALGGNLTHVLSTALGYPLTSPPLLDQHLGDPGFLLSSPIQLPTFVSPDYLTLLIVLPGEVTSLRW